MRDGGWPGEKCPAPAGPTLCCQRRVLTAVFWEKLLVPPPHHQSVFTGLGSSLATVGVLEPL